MQAFFYIVPLLLSLGISRSIIFDFYHPLTIGIWFLSIFLLIHKTVILKLKSFKKPAINKKILLTGLIILIPSLVRIALFNPSRVHQDDLIAAYISIKTDFTKDNFFGGIPSVKADWAGQFPSLFFFFQKIFFILFGESIINVKFSTIPYVFIISVCLYFLTKKILNQKAAILAVIFYTFFPMSLYLETMGFHFVSSSAVYILLIYIFIMSYQSKFISYQTSLTIGVICAFNYLFYMTSFVAFPLILTFYILEFILKRKLFVLKKMFSSIFAFLVVFLPFLTFAVFKENYFISRMNQVSLVYDLKSAKIKNDVQTLSLFQTNLRDSFLSFYTNGIGGHGGYILGHLAFFEEYALYLFTAGLFLMLFLTIQKKEFAFIFLAVLFSLPAMILSIPPPAYHRLSHAFSLIAMILAIPFYFFDAQTNLNKYLKNSIIAILVTLYILNNFRYFHKSIIGESYFEPIELANFINENYPNRHIYIASYPGFAFEKIYYFSKNKSAKSLKTDYHNEIYNLPVIKDKYLYIVIFPNDFKVKFQSLLKDSKIVYSSDDYLLFAN